MRTVAAAIALSLCGAAACSKAEPKRVPPLPPMGPMNPPAAPAAPPERIATAPGVSFDVPAGWRKLTPKSSMRLAELAPPRAAGDSSDAALVVTFFAGGAGTLEANVDRWVSQMSDASGQPVPRERAKIEEVRAGDLKITVVDVAGSFRDSGPMAGTSKPIEEARMIASQLDASNGSYFFKLVGPAATVTAARDAYLALLKSIRP